jgi:amino acid transporter
MWAYNGWHGVTPIAEEIRRPERNIPLALAGGIGAIVVLYIGANLAIHGVLSMGQVMASGEHAAEVMLETLLGPPGAIALAAVLVCSTLGAMNGDLLIAPRISFAMGRDGVFFRTFARVHPKHRTPVVAIAVQAGMSIALVLATGLLVEWVPSFQRDSVFELLTNFVIFAASIFYALTVLAVLVLRWRQPLRERPYRTWGYPIVPIVYLLVYAWFLEEVYASRPFEARSGLALIALGIPAYFALRAWNGRQVADD